MLDPWELSLLWSLTIVGSPREDARSETLKVGTIMDVLVHILALKRKEIAKRGVHGTVEVKCGERERRGASDHGGNATKSNDRPNRAPKAPRSREPDHNDVCFRCGSTEHWAKACTAPQNVANAYKTYREAREANYMAQEDQDGDLDLRVEDYKDQDPETGDFD